MKKLSLFVYSFLAGVDIAIAGIAFLSIDDKVVGTIFFSLGLFTVLVFGHNLYTGKICYIFDNPPSYIIDLVIIWVGNLLGSLAVGNLILMTRVASIANKAKTIANTKLNDNLTSIFILSVFCGILIYIAVDSFRNNPHEFGKYLGILFCVPGFILCGFEHCVANMLYFTVARVWSGKTLLFVVVMTLGNSVGGFLFPLLKKLLITANSKPGVPGKK